MVRRAIDDSRDMPIGSVRQVLVPGRAPLALYRLADGFHVTDDRCTHGGASLSEGEVDGELSD